MRRAKDWDEFFYLHRHDDPRPTKRAVAVGLDIHPTKLSKIITGSRDEPVSDRLVAAIAALWGQSAAFVRRVYPRRNVLPERKRVRYKMERYAVKD